MFLQGLFSKGTLGDQQRRLEIGCHEKAPEKTVWITDSKEEQDFDHGSGHLDSNMVIGSNTIHYTIDCDQENKKQQVKTFYLNIYL